MSDADMFPAGVLFLPPRFQNRVQKKAGRGSARGEGAFRCSAVTSQCVESFKNQYDEFVETERQRRGTLFFMILTPLPLKCH